MPEKLRETAAFVQEVNKHLMVKYINDKLLDRASLDVRRSIVVYDKDRVFVAAFDLTEKDFVELAENPVRLAALENVGVAYYSVGIV